MKPERFRSAGFAFLIMSLGLAGCAPRLETHGNLLDIESLAAIAPGQSDKGRVLALLGSPSTESEFGPETWMYIARRTEQTAFFAAETVEQQVIFIAFDGNGIVDGIGRLDAEDGRRVEYVNRETETAGQRISLLQQLLGNVGRFNNADNAGGGP